MINRKLIMKWAAVMLVLPALILASCARANSATSSPIGTGVVSKATVVNTIEATGSIAPGQLASLTWGTTGTVASVNVQTGQTVKAGTVLMSLDPASVPGNVLTAQTQLTDARLAFEQMTQPTLASISSATQALATASSTWMSSQTALNNTFSTRAASGDSNLYNTWDVSRAMLVDAESVFPLVNASIDVQAYYVAAYNTANLDLQLKSAQQASSLHSTDTLLAQKVTDLQAAVQASQTQQDSLAAGIAKDTVDKVTTLVNALLTYQQDAANYIGSIIGGSTAVADAAKLNATLASFQVAEQGFNDAIQNLYNIVRVPNQDDYMKAQEKYLAAQSAADSINLRAPFDGTVDLVYNKPGDVVTNTTTGAVVINRSSFYVTVQVDEMKVVQLSLGDTATVALEALPNLSLTGKVDSINPVGAANQGVVYYSVRVKIDQTDPTILPGATADVTIQAGQPQDAMAVPVSAIQNSGTTEYVTVIASDGSTKTVQVVSGKILADDRVVITGNLQIGDQVELVQSTTTSSTSGLGLRGGAGGIIGP
jgi:multidrug efflux pump subunit AcrA (membrane-fusion protein)